MWVKTSVLNVRVALRERWKRETDTTAFQFRAKRMPAGLQVNAMRSIRRPLREDYSAGDGVTDGKSVVVGGPFS